MTFKATLPERPTTDQVRSALLGAGEYLHGLRSKDESDRGEGFAADVRSATSFINDYDSVLTALVRGEQGDPASTEIHTSNPGRRSLGDMVVDSEAYEARGNLSATFASVPVEGSIFRNQDLFRTTITSPDDLTGGAGALLPQGQPIPPTPRQARLFVRDLLTVQTTGLASVPYVREYTPVTTEVGASSVAENTAKPEVEMLWESDDAPVRKVAGWVPVTTEILEDADTLAGYINGRLGYMVALREEQQVLNGAGTGPDLKGIYQYAGVQTQAFSVDVPQTLGLAISKIEAVDGDADAIIMHPTDYWTMLVTRYANQLDGGFGSGAPGAVPFQSVWGLPVIRSRASVTAGTAKVGAFRLGATLFDRMQTEIRIGNQHSDFFTTNKVAVLAEERIALAVHRPDFFVDVTALA